MLLFYFILSKLSFQHKHIEVAKSVNFFILSPTDHPDFPPSNGSEACDLCRPFSSEIRSDHLKIIMDCQSAEAML